MPLKWKLPVKWQGLGGGIRRSVDRNSDERAFLPAALEIVDTPPSPTGRATALTIVTVIVIAIGWAFFGKIDVIATAPGQIIPVGKTKIVQPREIGTVTAVHVKDGDTVLKGDLLVELDTTQSQADKNRFAQDLMQARLDLARLEGLNRATRGGAAPTLFQPPPNATETDIAATEAAMRAQADEQIAKLADIDQQIVAKAAEVAQANAAIERLNISLPLVQKQADLRERLMKMEFGNQLAFLQAKQQLVEQQQQVTVLHRQAEGATAGQTALSRKREQAVAEYRKNLIDDLNRVRVRINDLQAEFSKAEENVSLKTLRAPVDGTVQQVAIHTVGGVVTPAQILMVIVPDKEGLMVEAMINNRDIGFVRSGQPAEIKIDTFNFTRYGLIEGVVSSISRDAVAKQPNANRSENEEPGKDENTAAPVYVAHVMLSRNWIQTEGGRVLLGPGMAVATEIHTGRRRIIDFLFSPLAKKIDESFNER